MLLTADFSKLKKKKVDMSLAILAENNQNYTDYVNRRQEVYDRIKNPNAGMDSEIRSNFTRFSKDGSFKDLYRLSRSHKESKQVEERLRDVEFTIERFRVSSMGKMQPSMLHRQSTVSFQDLKPDRPDTRLLNLEK